jgi:hypothetical protein
VRPDLGNRYAALLWPGLNRLRMTRRAPRILAQQLDSPGLPSIVVVSARVLDAPARAGSAPAPSAARLRG